jgi:serine phosphatase RsbU (regulator of sigma subunit)
MSRVSADIERALGAGLAPSTVLSNVNDALTDIDSETFVTASCILLDTRRRTATVANAGHLPLIVRRASGRAFAWGEASGTPLGMVPCTYDEATLPLGPGDIVLAMTDGLVDALDHPTGRLGMEILLGVVREAPHDVRAIHERIRAAVDGARSRHALDDVTWVALQLAA